MKLNIQGVELRRPGEVTWISRGVNLDIHEGALDYPGGVNLNIQGGELRHPGGKNLDIQGVSLNIHLAYGGCARSARGSQNFSVLT